MFVLLHRLLYFIKSLLEQKTFIFDTHQTYSKAFLDIGYFRYNRRTEPGFFCVLSCFTWKNKLAPRPSMRYDKKALKATKGAIVKKKSNHSKFQPKVFPILVLKLGEFD